MQEDGDRDAVMRSCRHHVGVARRDVGEMNDAVGVPVIGQPTGLRAP